MTGDPIQPDQPDVGPYQVIHLGDQAAVIVPMADFLRLRALVRLATAEALEDAEDLAAVEEWGTREAAGQNSYVSMDDLRVRLGLSR